MCIETRSERDLRKHAFLLARCSASIVLLGVEVNPSSAIPNTPWLDCIPNSSLKVIKTMIH